jgi:hypothetical protein
MSKPLLSAALLALAIGCSTKPPLSQISGKVTFKGEPVPAGWITFTPDVAKGGLGQVQLFQINNGVYDSSKETPPGIAPGAYQVKIAGFDGKKMPFYVQGKQIFNPIDDEIVVPEGASTKDFIIPDSAGQNVKIQPTADT